MQAAGFSALAPKGTNERRCPDGAPRFVKISYWGLEEARETWMNAPIEEGLSLQRPPSAGALRVVAAGEKSDGAHA